MNQTVPTDDLHAVLQAFFWDFIDRGAVADATPLFSDGPAIARIIIQQFQLAPEQAEAVIEAARQEVAL
jgi:hypothetical protein